MAQIENRFAILEKNEEQRIVWGWAYVSEKDDAIVVDHSGEMIDADLVQKAAHGFVRDSRAGGVVHEALAGEIVDSLFFSKDVQRALGIDLGKVGWFIGMKVHDADAWARVKSGELRMFSIGGFAEWEEMDDAAAA